MKKAKRLIMLIATFLLAGIMGYTGCGGSGDNGESSSDNLSEPAGVEISRQIGPEGGEIKITDDTTSAQGVKLVVPPGAVAEGRSVEFYIRVIDAEGAQQINPAELDAAHTAMQFSKLQNVTIPHPFYATVLTCMSDLQNAGPVLEFGPEGIDFLAPVEIHIPFDKENIDEIEATYLSIFHGSYDAGSSTFTGARATDITIDYEAGVVVAKVRHLSFWQSISATLSPITRRIAELTYRPFVDLPYAPSLTQTMASSIVCSGIRPHVDISRLPNPHYLLYYLSSPMDAASRVNDPAQHAADRQYYQNQRVVVGHEVALENWVIAQPDDSVTCEALFEEAYKMVQGDVFQALLLSHNVLRGFDGQNREEEIRGIVIQKRMRELVGTGNRPNEVGYRYHYFGMATFGFIFRLYGYFTQDIYAGLEVPYMDVDDIMSRLIVYFEECAISADCTFVDPAEYAVDLKALETGQSMADTLFDGFYPSDDKKFHGVNLNEVADRYGVDTATCIEVDIRGERQYTLGENVSLNLVLTKGIGTTPGVEWFYLGKLLMTGPEFFYKFDHVGDYRLDVHVTDDSGLKLKTSVTVTISNIPAQVDEYLIYYTDNVRCWGAPWLFITDRASFNEPRLRSSYPGGGIDPNELAIKVEMQGGFGSVQDASDWICPRIEAWHFSYWCPGQKHYKVTGQELCFQLGALGCDLNGLPEVPIPDPHPGM